MTPYHFFIHTKSGKGFTLIETIVVVSITAFMSVTLGVLLSYFYRTNAYALEESTAVGQARRGVETAMANLREASYGSDGSYPIQSAATSTITFFSNVDTSSSIERVTYSLQKGVLYRIVATPVGNPLTYTGATLATSTLSTSVVNSTSTPVFRYYNSAGVELSAPVNIAQVASVKTTVVVDVNVNRSPVEFTLSGGATLRNLRTQL